MNRVTLYGNLGANPELRKLSNGTSLLKMRLATNHSFVNKEGLREDRTEWHQVLIWGARAEGLSRILVRGSALIIEGQIRTHSYEKDGEKRYSTEIHADNVILAGRRPGSEPRRDADEAEPLPFGLTPADLRGDAHEQGGGRDDDPGRGDSEPRSADERRDPRDFDLVPRDHEVAPSNGNGGAAAEPPPSSAPTAPRSEDGGAAQVPLPGPSPRDGGGASQLPLLPPMPRKKIRSPAGTPAMVAA